MDADELFLPGSGRAHDRAHRSRFTLVRITERRYALIEETGVAAYGVVDSSAMYGVKHGRVVEGCERMTWSQAHEIMRRIDLEGFDPDA